MLDEIYEGEAVDLALLPMLKHFASDRGPYITNAIIIAEDPLTGIANMSSPLDAPRSPDLATSLHSRGHLWRMLQTARERGEELRVAMVVGAHPLFMLAAAARLPFGSDERAVAGGLFGAPLELVKTPRYGIGVPAMRRVCPRRRHRSRRPTPKKARSASSAVTPRIARPTMYCGSTP